MLPNRLGPFTENHMDTDCPWTEYFSPKYKLAAYGNKPKPPELPLDPTQSLKDFIQHIMNLMKFN